MPRPVLLLTGASYYHGSYVEEHWPRLLERCDVRLTELSSGPEWLAQIAEADVIMPRRIELGRDSLEVAPRLRGIVTPGVGVERVDVAAATELGIVVANSPGNTVTVAESTILLALALGKQMLSWIQAARRGQAPTSSMHGMELYGKTIGIVGFGRIGKWVAELATAIRMNVLAHDPYVQTSPTTATGKPLAELVTLDELLRRSDF